MSKLGAHERILSTPAITIFLRCKKRGDGVLSLPESLFRQSPMSGEEAGRASSMFCAHAVLGWQCVRAGQIFHARDVMTTVWEEIMRADLIVADLTGQNANVFYELGFAHALNKDTILLTQTIGDVPFDLRQRRLVEYAPDKAGQRALRRAIDSELASLQARKR